MSKFNFDNQPVPATPKTGHTFVYVDDVLKVLSSKDDTGAVTNYGSGGGPIPNLGQVLTAGNDGGAKKIINILDPTLAQDAATKAYVDGLIQPTPDLGAVLTVGNDAGAKKILNLLDPTLAQDAATKAYVDGLIPATPGLGPVLTVSNDGGAKKIVNILDPTLAQDAATKAYVDGLISAAPKNYIAFLLQELNLTAGLLVIGKKYTIDLLQAGDDFTNVGYVADLAEFIATGTTPTVWTNATVVIPTPVITLVNNTLGSVPVCNRSSIGRYTLTAAGIFTSNKTICPPFGTQGTNSVWLGINNALPFSDAYNIQRVDVNSLELQVVESAAFGFVELNSVINNQNLLISVQVYP